MIQIGCAWLSKSGSLTGGWASLAGGEPFKFTDLEYLRSKGPIWVTQANPATFNAEGGSRFPWMRHGEFLSTPLPFLAEELAVVESPQRACVMLSEILTRTVNLGEEVAPGLINHLLDIRNSKLALHEVMQMVISPAGRKLVLPPDLQAALPNLFRGFPTKDSTYNDILVRVPAARVVVFEEVMSGPVPGDNWSEIPKELYPNPLTWAQKEDVPIIAQVLIVGKPQNFKDKDREQVSRDLSLFHNITTGTRRWMALPEIIALSKVFDLRAERTFKCEDIVPVSATLKVAPPIFSPVARASISAGLVAETFLSASALPSPISDVTLQGKSAVNPYSVRSVWINSLIRSLMIEAAISAARARVSVQGLGFGHLMVGCRKDKLRGLRLAINKNDYLSYPTGLRNTEERFTPKSRAVLSTDTVGGDDQEGGY